MGHSQLGLVHDGPGAWVTGSGHAATHTSTDWSQVVDTMMRWCSCATWLTGGGDMWDSMVVGILQNGGGRQDAKKEEEKMGSSVNSCTSLVVDEDGHW